jgi:phosphoserine phosphatase RsbU/P
MYCVRWHPSAYLGIENGSPTQVNSALVSSVQPGSAAELAGLRPGDQILAINGKQLEDLEPFYRIVSRGKPGDVITLQVQRPGTSTPVTFHATLRPWPAARGLSLAETLGNDLLNVFPVWFVLVSMPVLFLRIEDRNAWLLAILFSSFIAGAPLFPFQLIIPHGLRSFTLGYKVIFYGLFPAIFYSFFAMFPASSGVDRRMPWLKTALFAGAITVVVPVSLLAVAVGNPAPVWDLGIWVSKHQPLHWVIIAYYLGSFVLGLVSLAWNGFCAPAADVRRKIRVIVWGTVVGLTPGMVLDVVAIFTGKQVPELLPVWLWGPIVVGTFWLFPLSFAYAVVKHRVLEIPILLKRSARYFLVQRGFVVVHVLLNTALTVILALAFSRVFKSSSPFPIPALLTAAVIFGSVLALSGLRLHHVVTRRIDRAFFRSSYDARQVLENLVDKTRLASSREKLAALLEGEIEQALHPTAIGIYLEESDGRLTLQPDGSQQKFEPILSMDIALLRELQRHAGPWELIPQQPRISLETSAFGSVQPECLVPMLGSDSQLRGVVVLGTRLSEESYSREDRRLLASVAGQAAGALENIRLAEKMAERMEAERRVAIEMQVAKEVQDKLLPQCAPVLQTLECAGRCIQTRSVGGDYYDFLDLGPGHVGLVLGDVSGKGISAALLMANLQASLRSRCVGSSGDIPLRLSAVNEQLRKSSGEGYFATLFFADYDDSSRLLLFSNCGHNPPILLRTDGKVDRLAATATVLGLFEKWQCSTQETTLHPGDLLVIYSDGVTEAMNQAGEEFGETRFIASLRDFRSFAPTLLLTNVVSTVQEFTGGFQSDDLTLLIARAF